MSSLREQIATVIGQTMILRTSADEIAAAVIKVVQPALDEQVSVPPKVDETGLSLRDQIGRALYEWLSVPDQPRLALSDAGVAREATERALAVVQPELDARDADLRASREATARWEASSVKAERERDALADMFDGLADSHLVLGDVAVANGDKCVPWCPKCAIERAAQAEAERDQLRYERRLLSAARMTLDLVAAGDESRWDEVRQAAEDVAQRIVDEIGHSVTDEPALGPSFREQIVQLTAERARLKAAVERVREIHECIPCGCAKCRGRREGGWGAPDEVCRACSVADGAFGAVVWPCPTIAALDEPEEP